MNDQNKCSSYEICSCCGFGFGYDDNDQRNTFKQYREKWISKGAIWFDEKYKPDIWSLYEQLCNIE